MHLSLSEVMNQNGEDVKVEAALEQGSVRVGRDSYQVTGPFTVMLRARKVAAKSVDVYVKAELSLEIPCSRCLEPVTYPFNIDVEHRYVFDGDGSATIDDDEEKVSYIDGYDLDVDALIGEEVIIGFPMKVLCDEDCKGLCKVCGANLNRGECGCDRTEPDPRMSIIKDLFNMKEV